MSAGTVTLFYPGDITLWCVRWYLGFPISFVHMAEMAIERGLFMHPNCIWRWVHVLGPRSAGRHLRRDRRDLPSTTLDSRRLLPAFCRRSTLRATLRCAGRRLPRWRLPRRP